MDIVGILITIYLIYLNVSTLLFLSCKLLWSNTKYINLYCDFGILFWFEFYFDYVLFIYKCNN